MKIKLSLFILVSLFCIKGFSQEDHLGKQKRSKEDKAKDEGKLNAKGKEKHEKAKKDFAELSGATFEIAANEVQNQDPTELLGISSIVMPDEKLGGKQQEENKKNQKEINTKAKKDSKNDKAEINVDASAAAPAAVSGGVGASWTDAYYWNPSTYTPVKNQGGCGSCWAFAACAAFEHTYKKWYGVQLDLSEQDVVACGQTCGLWGLFKEDCGSCGGGWSDKAFDYIKCSGVALESSYGYTATSGPCYSRPKSKSAYTWGQLINGSADWVKYYITIYGSVVSYMKAGISTFYAYSSGVYNGWPNAWGGGIDHAVTIVGWSNYWNAWIIKNSWGPGWGSYGGYAYIGYNQCNLAKYVYWVYPNA